MHWSLCLGSCLRALWLRKWSQGLHLGTQLVCLLCSAGLGLLLLGPGRLQVRSMLSCAGMQLGLCSLCALLLLLRCGCCLGMCFL